LDHEDTTQQFLQLAQTSKILLTLLSPVNSEKENSIFTSVVTLLLRIEIYEIETLLKKERARAEEYCLLLLGKVFHASYRMKQNPSIIRCENIL
jgi:hypothetical protein